MFLLKSIINVVIIIQRSDLSMAKYEKEIKGSFSDILDKIEKGILGGSLSATLEEKTDFISSNSRCSVRVFERYSYLGKNRVSLNVTLFQESNEPVQLSAITSGGSQAVLFKINTIGEDLFLDKLKEID